MQNIYIENYILMAASEDNFFGNFPEWLLLKDNCKDIFILQILSSHILYFLLWRHVKKEQIFMRFFR